MGHYDAHIDRSANVEQYATVSTFIRDDRREAHDYEVRAVHAHNIQLMWDSGEDDDDGATGAVARGSTGGAGGASPPYAVAAADAGPAGASQSRKRRRESKEATAEAEERRATTKRTKGEAATVLQVDEEVEPPAAGSPRAMTVEAAAAMQGTENAVMRTATVRAAAPTAPGGMAPGAATPSKKKKRRSGKKRRTKSGDARRREKQARSRRDTLTDDPQMGGGSGTRQADRTLGVWTARRPASGKEANTTSQSGRRRRFGGRKERGLQGPRNITKTRTTYQSSQLSRYRRGGVAAECSFWSTVCMAMSPFEGKSMSPRAADFTQTNLGDRAL